MMSLRTCWLLLLLLLQVAGLALVLPLRGVMSHAAPVVRSCTT
jgi:hypothetical protein